MAEQIGTRILGGVYPPGQTLAEEPLLCEEFGVSRTVVREAVRMLVAKGMLEVRPRIGTRVLDPKDWQLLDRAVLQWQQGVQLDGGQLKDLIELRQAVEPDAAALAAQRRTDGDMQAIRDALAQMEKTVGQNNEYVVADARFHIAILHTARNRYFDALENAIFTGLLLSIRLTNPDAARNRKSLPLHRDISDAIADGDAAQARRAMTAHLTDAAARLAARLDAAPDAR
ncbi:FadR/GntR family transcriptional regulator [Yoonia sp. SS1-5]|uniref:FadR/GntR family transcriptional regulator n=1 Tax=Yoonia rhodophyticola TaxID=3137370 RepID=A0AAN0MCG5_9RHOB